MMSTVNMDHVIKVLKSDEGVVNNIYTDHLGYYTIGVGHLLTKEKDKNKAIQELDTILKRNTNGIITEEETESILKLDVDKTIQGIERSPILKPVYDKLSPTRRIGLISMCFQMGIKGVESFKNSLRMIEQGNWDLASNNLKQSLWYKQTPKRAERVINIITKEDLKPYGIYA